MKKSPIILCAALLSIFALFLCLYTIDSAPLYADTAAELQANIDKRNADIKALEQEIAEYQTKLDTTYEQGQTLKTAVAGLDLTQKKLQAEINLTQKKIDATTLEIGSLSNQIGDKQSRITAQRGALDETLRRMRESEDESLIESLFLHKKLSEVWNNVAMISQLQSGIETHVTELKDLKESLTKAKTDTETKKKQLVQYQVLLANQKKIVVINKAEKDKLLKQTKNQENIYRNLLAEKQAKRDAFAAELFSYESQLKLTIDPNSIPHIGKGILNWPLDKVFITQRFGVTSFSMANPTVYNGQGHNGVDFRASEGTPIKAALAGVVLGTGNTDIVCPGASYGEWILIRHDNGLSTLYAHLSLIGVREGQNVGTGEIIGYSGSTGYATGPHLHFTLYATQGVQITSRKSKVCAGTYRMPVANFQGYLNPLLYL